MADVAHIAGLIVAGVMKNPFDAGFHVMTSTTHKTLRGPRGGLILTKGIVGNPLRAVDQTIENLPTLIDRTVFPGLQGGPHMNTILAKAVAFKETQTDEFKAYARQTVANAKKLAEHLMAQNAKLITNGTDNHLVLMDVYTSFGIDGDVAEKALDKAGLTTNKNVIPNDTLPPFKPSGIRIGTPAITTRGFKEADMEHLASWIITVLQNVNNEEKLAQIKREVADYAHNFPLPTKN